MATEFVDSNQPPEQFQNRPPSLNEDMQQILRARDTEGVCPDSWAGYTRPVKIVPPGVHYRYPFSKRLKDWMGDLVRKVLNNSHTP